MKQGCTKKPVGDICKILNGFAFKSNEYVDDGVRVLRITNVQKGYIVDDDPQFFPIIREKEISRYMLYEGDLLMSLTGNVGRVGVLSEEFLPAALNQRVACLRIKESAGVNLKYLFHIFNSKTFEDDCIVNATGIAQKNMSTKWLENYLIPVPPIAEQEKIVAELDCLSGIIEKKKQQLKELDNLAQSIFYEMFSNQDGTPVKLSQACSVVRGLVNPNDEPYCNYPHIGGANIESHTGKFVNVKLAKEENLISGKYPFDDTMILYSKIRPNLNKVALPSFKGICSADMYPLIPQNEFDKVFLKYILTQKVFLDYAISHSGRANIPKINREDLLNYEFLTYPITLQQDFASKIEAIEKQKELIKQSIQETETLFNSRMDYYFG